MTQNLPNPDETQRPRVRRVRRPVVEVAEDEDISPLGNAPGKPRGGGGGLMQTVLVSLVVAVVVAYAVISFVGVSRTDFTNNLGALVTDLGAVKQTQTTQTSSISSIQNSLSNYITTAQLATQLSGYALKSDIPKPTDLSGYYSKAEVDDLLKAATDRIKELEDWKAGQGTMPTPTTQVTVALDPNTPLTQILATPTSTTTPFYVRITNGTSTPQYVTYSVILTVSAPTLSANMATYTLKMSGAAYGGTQYTFVATPVPNATAAQQIIFTFPLGTAPKIPILPGQTVTMYNYLTLQTDNSLAYAYWEGSLTGIAVSATP